MARRGMMDKSRRWRKTAAVCLAAVCLAGMAGCGSRGIALACASLSFPHPVTGERMSFVSLPVGAPWDRFDTRAAVGLI